jgi:hypothetical protein
MLCLFIELTETLSIRPPKTLQGQKSYASYISLFPVPIQPHTNPTKASSQNAGRNGQMMSNLSLFKKPCIFPKKSTLW